MPKEDTDTRPDAQELTTEERDQMAHAIGHATAKGCSVKGGRNYYITSADDSVWVGLVDRGLATSRSSWMLRDGEARFRVTDEGRAAVESDPRTLDAMRARGRLYVIRFRGNEDHPTTAWGVTRGQAKAAAARVIDDVFPDGGAYMRIVSCRLAGPS